MVLPALSLGQWVFAGDLVARLQVGGAAHRAPLPLDAVVVVHLLIAEWARQLAQPVNLVRVHVVDDQWMLLWAADPEVSWSAHLHSLMSM